MNFKYWGKGVCASVCVCIRWDSFWVGRVFFQTFIYLTLVFHVCVYIYIKQYISHFSVPDNRPMILVTSSTPQATYPDDAEAGSGWIPGVKATLTQSASSHCSPRAHLPWDKLRLSFSSRGSRQGVPASLPASPPAQSSPVEQGRLLPSAGRLRDRSSWLTWPMHVIRKRAGTPRFKVCVCTLGCPVGPRGCSSETCASAGLCQHCCLGIGSS